MFLAPSGKAIFSGVAEIVGKVERAPIWIPNALPKGCVYGFCTYVDWAPAG